MSSDQPTDEYTLEDYAEEKELPEEWLREEFNLHTRSGREVAILYRDRDGEFVAMKYRTADGFRWAEGAGPIVYGLDRLANADAGRTVLIVEGESDVHACAYHDVPAVGVPGASSWESEWAEELADDRDIYVWREPDEGGDTLVRAVADDLPEAQVIEAPEDAKDPADLHVAAGSDFKHRLADLMVDAPTIETIVEELGDGGDVPPSRENQDGRLLALAENLDFFHDERDTAYVRLEQNDHLETWRVGGETFQIWLALRYYRHWLKPPSSDALTQAVQVLKGRARFDGETRKLANRIGWHEGDLWYDLADGAWRAIRITPGEWQIVDQPPPLFRRYAHQNPQVEPVTTPAEKLPELLEPFLNLPDDATQERVLVHVWPVTALVADVPRAVLIPHGPQGSAKSAVTKMVRSLVDPSAVPIPNFPTRRRELAQALDHNAVLALDNVSQLNRSLSDTLCRAVTGGGFSKRKLYTDEEDVLFQFRRAVIINGINIPATRADLLDRSILIGLERIPEEEMQPEKELRAEFEEVRPKIFGAMLDALARAMEIEADIDPGPLPRMADWTRWGCAVAEAMGIGGDRFFEAYQANRRIRNEEALTSHPVGAAVMAFMRRRSEWTGTATHLLDELERVAAREGLDTGSKLWPAAASWLSRRIREVKPNLTDAGIRWEPEWRWDDTQGKIVRLWKPDGDDDG